jgi:hypothetical protein
MTMSLRCLGKNSVWPLQIQIQNNLLRAVGAITAPRESVM